MIKLIQYILFFIPLVTFAQQKWTLEDCITHASNNNIEVLKQQVNNKNIEENILVAKGDFYPNLSFTGSQGFSLGNSFDVSTGVGQRESSFNRFSLSSSVVLFNGFGNKYKLNAEKIIAKKARSDLDNIKLDLSTSITNKYLQVLFNKEILTIATEQEKISEKHVTRLNKLFVAFLKPKNDLLQMQATHALDQKEVIIAKNNLTNSLIDLKELIDINDMENFDIVPVNIDRVKDKLLTSPSNIYINALNKNPRIKSKEFSLDITKENIKIAKSNYYPTLQFNYSFGSNYYHIIGEKDLVYNQTTSQFENNGFMNQLNNNKTHYLGLSLTVPIFNKFLTKTSIEKAKNEFDLATIELKNNRHQLKNKIIKAYNDVLSSKATLEATKIALVAQKESFDIMQNKYKKGLITSYEFLESKSKYIHTQSELLRAKYEYIFKMKVLDFY